MIYEILFISVISFAIGFFIGVPLGMLWYWEVNVYNKKKQLDGKK